MSRKIDFSKPLSKDDQRYVNDRPWLIVDAELNGFTEEEETEEDTDEETEEDTDEETEEDTGYESLKVADLKALIEERNEDREDEDLIDPESDRKADLIAALEADDEDE